MLATRVDSKRRYLATTLVDRKGTAWLKCASAWQINCGWNVVTFWQDAISFAEARIVYGNGGDQHLRIRVCGGENDLFGRTFLNDATQIHHRHMAIA